MKEDPKSDMNRRAFLRKSAVAIAATTCLASGSLRDLVTAAQASGKPILTQASVNALVPAKLPTGAAYQNYVKMINQIKANPVAYFQQNFTLNAAQLQKLQSLSQAQISQMLNNALQNKYQPQVAIVTAPAGAHAKTRMQKAEIAATVKEEPHGGWSGTCTCTLTY